MTRRGPAASARNARSATARTLILRARWPQIALPAVFENTCRFQDVSSFFFQVLYKSLNGTKDSEIWWGSFDFDAYHEHHEQMVMGLWLKICPVQSEKTEAAWHKFGSHLARFGMPHDFYFWQRAVLAYYAYCITLCIYRDMRP